MALTMRVMSLKDLQKVMRLRERRNMMTNVHSAHSRASPVKLRARTITAPRLINHLMKMARIRLTR